MKNPVRFAPAAILLIALSPAYAAADEEVKTVPVGMDAAVSQCLIDVTAAGRLGYLEAETYCKDSAMKEKRPQFLACLRLLTSAEIATNWSERGRSCWSDEVQADVKSFLACSLQLSKIPVHDSLFLHKNCSDPVLRKDLGGATGYADFAYCVRAVSNFQLLNESEAAARCLKRDVRALPDVFAACVKGFREAGLVQDYLLGASCAKVEVRREMIAFSACIRTGKARGLIGEKASFDTQDEYLKFCESDANRRSAEGAADCAAQLLTIPLKAGEALPLCGPPQGPPKDPVEFKNCIQRWVKEGQTPAEAAGKCPMTRVGPPGGNPNNGKAGGA